MQRRKSKKEKPKKPGPGFFARFFLGKKPRLDLSDLGKIPKEESGDYHEAIKRFYTVKGPQGIKRTDMPTVINHLKSGVPVKVNNALNDLARHLILLQTSENAKREAGMGNPIAPPSELLGALSELSEKGKHHSAVKIIAYKLRNLRSHQ